MLSKVSINRLLEAAEILEAFKPTKFNKFDISSWMSKPDEKDDNANACGTTACACGIIASQPKIRKRGFRLEYQREPNDETYLTIKGKAVVVPVYQATLEYTNKNGEVSEAFDAAADYFGISENVATYFFSGGEYYTDRVTAKQVAKRIRQYVQQHTDRAA